jgi:dienelactone hydrolase
MDLNAIIRVPLMLTACAGAAALSGCSCVCCHLAIEKDHGFAIAPGMARERVDGLDVLVFPSTSKNPGPVKPVLLLHEITGLNCSLYDFVNRLTADDFTVYLPRMFGSLKEEGRLAIVRDYLYVFLSPDWPTLVTGRSPAVLPELREVLNRVATEHAGRPIGVIGQCLTGSVPIALLTDNRVRAVAACHPALPFLPITRGRARALGLTDDDANAGFSQGTAGGKAVYLVRFETDVISTEGRIGRIEDAIKAPGVVSNATIMKSEYGSYYTDSPHHSVFCEEYNGTPGSPTLDRYDKLVACFHEALRQPLPGTP